jgi:hypothetical protein
MKDLEKLKEIYITANDVDEETRKENLEEITKWENALIESEAYGSWQSHDITRSISKRAKDTYKELSMILAMDRKITQEQRVSLWAKQDAALWLLTLTDVDVKSTIDQIHSDIKRAISAA